MKKLVFASIMAASLCSFAAIADDISGYVSESHCGAKHDSVSAANTKCIETCLKGGSDPVLVKDGKVIAFDADSKDKARGYAGKEVKIDGSMEGDVIKVNSIEEAKAEK
ncbi:MAG: hypothetical protein WB992_04500 [Bryobacteraceae bacterium]